MQPTEKIWFNGKLVPWTDAKIHLLTHALHYGSGVFEGIRVYDTVRGSAAFRLDDHMDRWLYSAAALSMNVPYTKQELTEAIAATVKINNMRACYIRPIMYYGYNELKVIPVNCPIEVAIAVWPWGAYLSEGSIRIKIIDDIRLFPRSVFTNAKITGHYNHLMHAAQQAVNQGYNEALLLDHDGNIAEGPGENFFMVKNGTVVTPSLGCILPGITRASIIKLARELNIPVEERAIDREEIFTADECFFTGTAAEVSPIGSVDNKPMRHEFGPITKKIKDGFTKIINGENPDYDEWLTFIS